MAESPFSITAESPRQSRLDRMLRRPDMRGAVAELERSLSASWPAPTRASVVAVLLKHHVNGRDARAVCVSIFAKALRAYALNNELSVEDARNLRMLQSTLGLIQRDIGEAHRQVADAIYSSALSGALDEEDLTPDERARLDSLTGELRISPERRGLLHREQAQVILQRLLGKQTPHRFLTTQEHEALYAMADKFGTKMDFDVATLEHFDRFALLWQIENGELPSVTTTIELQKGEVCHFYSPARWLEPPAETSASSGHRSSGSIRIVKGLSFRAGRDQARPGAGSDLIELAAGIVYITNRRFILAGNRKRITLRHADVLALDPYTDGFAVETRSGKPATVVIEGDVEIAIAIASEALARA